MKIILSVLCLFTAFNVNAKEISVTAYGEGENYDWAVLNAVENAVRQTSDIAIQGNGLKKIDVSSSVTHESNFEGAANVNDSVSIDMNKKNGIMPKTKHLNIENKSGAEIKTNAKEEVAAKIQDNSKEILAKYNGVVSSYEVLEQSEENGKYKVKIRATVFKEDVYDAHDYKSKSLVKKADYSLAIMPFKVAPNVNCLGSKPNSNQINTIISSLFIEKLAPSRKFNLVDRNNLDDYASEMSIVESDMTLPENKVKLKNLVSADYILVGTVDSFTATSDKNYIALTGETNYSSYSKLKLSYRILETATMEIVSAGSAEKNFSKEGKFSSCTNVEQLLFERAISEAVENILTDIFPDYPPIKKVKEQKPIKKAASSPAPDYSLPLY